MPVTIWPAPQWFLKFLDYGGKSVANLLVVTTFLMATGYYFLLSCRLCGCKCSVAGCAACLREGAISCVCILLCAIPSACLRGCATNYNKVKCTCTHSSCTACWRNCTTCLRTCKRKLQAFRNWSFTAGSRLLNVLMFPGLCKKRKDQIYEPKWLLCKKSIRCVFGQKSGGQ